MKDFPQPQFYEDWREWGGALISALAEQTTPPLIQVSKDRLPDPALNFLRILYVHDATGGPVVAYSNKTQWLRLTDDTLID